MNGTPTLDVPVERGRPQPTTGRRPGMGRCPRCNGNLFVNHEDYRTVLRCLQCGREFDPVAATPAASRAA